MMNTRLLSPSAAFLSCAVLSFFVLPFAGCNLVVGSVNAGDGDGDGDSTGDGDGDGDATGDGDGDGDTGGDGDGDGDTGGDGDGDGDTGGDGDGDGDTGGDGDGDGDTGGDGDGDGDPVLCDDVVDAPTLPTLIANFETQIYPLMNRTAAEGGCVDCHGPDLPGAFALGGTATDTFHKVRTAGYFDFTPLNLYDRVERALMPPAPNPAWDATEIEALRVFTCEAQAYEAANPTPLDEVFPPGLLEPYDGPAIDTYDNTFLSYAQLRGRVLQQFGDDWVRMGQDQFAENIALFGGVDFENAFIPARAATAEFLVGMDLLAEDVCGDAAAMGTGPFAGLDLGAPLQDTAPESTVLIDAANLTVLNSQGNPGTFQVSGNPPSLNLYSNGTGRVDHTFPSDGVYEITVSAQGDEAGPDLPRLQIDVDGAQIGVFDVPEPAGFQDYAATVTLTAGAHLVDAKFINDYYAPDDPDPNNRDRNLRIQRVQIRGPIGAGAGDDTIRDATLDRLALVFERTLLRFPVRDADPAVDEIEPLYALLVGLDGFDGNRTAAYAGVCEGLVRHPDFLFTRPARHDVATDPGERERLLLIKSALDLIDRPPNDEELGRFDLGAIDRNGLIDEWLASDAFRAAFYHKMRILLETDGSVSGDEPARMLTYLFIDDRPIRDLLVAEYGIDEAFQPVARPAEHGPTGVLTMPGYIRGKPGLPHYNYAARVLTGFMGNIFEVPPEVFDERDTATAASTVDPESICYACHKLLTPLAHQRLAWDDDGNYRTTLEDGSPVDDSDHGLVDGYPYAGNGVAAFTQKAIRKEGFIRRMANTQFQMVFNRQLRHEQDERDLYYSLWEAADHGEGTFRTILKTVMNDEAYTAPGVVGGN